MQDCPCCSQKAFEDCCEPYLSGKKIPETAEQMMRARYTAYTLVDMDFIEKTHDPKTLKKTDMADNRKWAESTKWLGLEILSTEQGQTDDEVGQVEFKAKFTSQGKEDTHHEVSLFTKKQGNWYFTDGKSPRHQTVVRETPKIRRNEPCPCGSGKKYKKCCGMNS